MVRTLTALCMGPLLVVAAAKPALRAGAAGPATRPAAAPQPRFADATEALGLRGLSGSKAAWGDFDGDGWPDLYAAGQLWRNVAGQRFERVEKARLGGAGVWGDFDNDGRRDLFCWSGGPKLIHRELASGGSAVP